MTPRYHPLDALTTLLDRSEVTYQAYVKNNNSFLYAKILRDCNEAIRELLLSNVHFLPSEIRHHAIALLHPIDVWCALWDFVEKSEMPAQTDAFTFDNCVNFPKQEVALLVDYLDTWKSL